MRRAERETSSRVRVDSGIDGLTGSPRAPGARGDPRFPAAPAAALGFLEHGSQRETRHSASSRSPSRATDPAPACAPGFPAAGGPLTQRVADDFTVCDAAGWTVSAIELFAWQDGAPTAPSPIESVFLAIHGGDPSAGAAPVAGSPAITTDLAANVLREQWTGVYRTAWNGVAIDASRAVQQLLVRLPVPVALPQGTYWLAWSFTGSAALPGPFVPPLTVIDKGATGNAVGYQSGAWVPLVSGSAARPKGLPFRLFGARPSAPGSFTESMPGCGSAGLDVAGAPVIGGFLRVALTNPTPGTLGFVGLDLAPTAIPVCSCLARTVRDGVRRHRAAAADHVAANARCSVRRPPRGCHASRRSPA